MQMDSIEFENSEEKNYYQIRNNTKRSLSVMPGNVKIFSFVPTLKPQMEDSMPSPLHLFHGSLEEIEEEYVFYQNTFYTDNNYTNLNSKMKSNKNITHISLLTNDIIIVENINKPAPRKQKKRKSILSSLETRQSAKK